MKARAEVSYHSVQIILFNTGNGKRKKTTGTDFKEKTVARVSQNHRSKKKPT